MRTLFKNARVVDVFTDSIIDANVLIEDDKIIGVGAYTDADANEVRDVNGGFICPGFIDGHIHIESSMLSPYEFAKAALPRGTTAIIADPHEIANVCGLDGIVFMLEESEGLPLSIYYMMPSCVPATPLDEAGAIIGSEDICEFYDHPRVLGLGEMMNYPGVISRDSDVIKKISSTLERGLIVNGHAPMLSGRELDSYIAAGIFDDHECSSFDEARERIQKGQWVMVRQGTAARNLSSLIGLFEEPYSRRCLLVTDDKHPLDLLEHGHIDSIIREAVKLGKSPLTGIRMATIQAAACFGLKHTGAVAPGYYADLLILDDLDSVKVRDVYCKGKPVVSGGNIGPFDKSAVPKRLQKIVTASFHLDPVKPEDFMIKAEGNRCRVISLVPDQLITNEDIIDIDFSKENGIDSDRDILKIAVIERHKRTGHIGLGFIHGMGLKAGAIASSVSHDSHNLIVVGTSCEEMSAAANRVIEMGGGLAVSDKEKIVSEMPLPIAGLMGLDDAREMAAQNEAVRKAAKSLGADKGIEPFMNLAFVSLPVIPNLKMTTQGLVDVNSQKIVSLFA